MELYVLEEVGIYRKLAKMGESYQVLDPRSPLLVASGVFITTARSTPIPCCSLMSTLLLTLFTCSLHDALPFLHFTQWSALPMVVMSSCDGDMFSESPFKNDPDCSSDALWGVWQNAPRLAYRRCSFMIRLKR